jgi:hypothetical protein
VNASVSVQNIIAGLLFLFPDLDASVAESEAKESAQNYMAETLLPDTNKVAISDTVILLNPIH